ncbi:TPA: fimbrial protein [Haemophilus influenzae]|uniref:fimbrial protein n=1 Tax=Haemophilus influenzae TaxID=727 RepID=UPI003988EB49
MKKTILALLALGVFGANSAFATKVTTQNQEATHARITVKGEVVTQTCQISSNDRERTVQLDKVGTNSLQRAGDIAAQKLITLHLENCATSNGIHTNATAQKQPQNKVTVTFNHTDNVDIQNHFTLKNKAPTDAAKNVNIQLADTNGNGIKIGQSEDDSKLRLKNVNPTPDIQFLARYYATGPSEAGLVEAEAELDLAYE